MADFVVADLSFNFSEFISLSKDLDYKIITDEGLSKDLSYSISNEDSIQKDLNYSIDLSDYFVIADLAFNFQGLTLGSIQKNLSYSVTSNGELSKELSYSVDSTVLKIGIFNDIHWYDWLHRPDNSNDTHFPYQVTKMNTLNRDLVILVGDQFTADYFPAAPDNTTMDAEIAKFLTEANKLNAPWYWLWGNHDNVRGGYNYDPERMRELLTDNGVDWSFPRKVTLNGIDLIFLKVNHFTDEIPNSQLEWLENNLGANPTFVFNHYPMNSIYDPPKNIQNSEEFRAVLENNGNVKAFFSGHDHTHTSQTLVNGIYYIANRRAGGFSIPEGVERGFGVLDIYEDRFEYYSLIWSPVEESETPQDTLTVFFQEPQQDFIVADLAFNFEESKVVDLIQKTLAYSVTSPSGLSKPLDYKVSLEGALSKELSYSIVEPMWKTVPKKQTDWTLKDNLFS